MSLHSITLLSYHHPIITFKLKTVPSRQSALNGTDSLLSLIVDLNHIIKFFHPLPFKILSNLIIKKCSLLSQAGCENSVYIPKDVMTNFPRFMPHVTILNSNTAYKSLDFYCPLNKLLAMKHCLLEGRKNFDVK